MKIKFSEVLELYELVNFGYEYEHEGFICTKTGKTYYHSNVGDNEEVLPEDIYENEQYVAIPTKKHLGLGRDLVFDFIDLKMPDEYMHVRNIFSRKGAYSRYKSFLADKGCLNEWYNFEIQSTEKALRDWCLEQNIEVIG